MIHVFHGFLGSPEDFLFLKKDDVVLHDLYRIDHFPAIREDDTLIGYSMGGRLCLDLAEKLNFRIRKLVLINAHPGLSTQEEKSERKIFEGKILENLSSMTREEFLIWWNGLPLFRFDQPIETSPERFEKSSELFKRYLLSEQKDHLPKLSEYKDKIIYIVGLMDEKYMELAGEKILPHDISIKGISGGHRLYQNRKDLKTLLTEEGIL
jgi:2-succinyl-6-hydroxy-2,4-cyclohexadiene-1-carboxylate synthase